MPTIRFFRKVAKWIKGPRYQVGYQFMYYGRALQITNRGRFDWSGGYWSYKVSSGCFDFSEGLIDFYVRDYQGEAHQ